MLKRKLSIGFFMALVLALVASQVSAGSIFFNVIVPRLGGNTNTNVTTKNTTTQQWNVTSIQVGNGYTVQFRPYKSSNTAIGSWNVGTTGGSITANYSPTQPVGTLIYLKIKNNLSTTVAVQVSGYFNSN
ncbi:MAG: hypothetical protein HOP27_17405 [Anaerolineales bacterium]|jgi:hypothetical protein|nr:hypothetical protein [Anaerolineales bacterium]